MMKQMMWMLVLSLISFSSWADDDEIQTCNIKLNKDFSVLVDYGHVRTFSSYDDDEVDTDINRADDDDADDDDFEEEVLYITTRSSTFPIKLWSNDDDEKDAIFYAPNIDDGDSAEIRIDFSYNSKKGQEYRGVFTYYIKTNGSWLEQATSSQVINIGTKHAQALIEDDDENDELHNLRCDDLDTPPKPPVFKLDICPYVPNTIQTNSIYQTDPNDPNSVIPHGALQIASGGTNSPNFVQVSNFKDEFFLKAQTGTKDCRFPDGSFGDCKTTNKVPVDDFPPKLVWKPNNEGSDKSCEDGKEENCNLTAGTYKDVTIKEGQTLTLQGGVYYFKELKFAEENVALEILGPTEIHYKKIMFEKSGVRVNAGPNAQPSESLLIIGHGEESHFYPKDDANDILINAYVYVDNMADSDDNGFNFSAEKNKLVGGVTANSISISGRNNTIHASNKLNCFAPPSSDISTINIVPSNIYLQCADSKRIYVEVFDKDGQPVSDIGDSMVSLYSSTPNTLTFSLVRFDADKSRFEFSIDSKAGNNYGEIEVVAHVVGDNSISDNSHVVFAPAVFDINDGQEKELIAGKADQVGIKVLACDSNGNTVTGNYNKTFTQNDLQNTSFVPGQWGDNADELSFDADIKQGLADATIQFDEAGQYTGRFIDTIKCEDFYTDGVEVVDCPKGESKEIIGELKFKARPWTFAVCRSDITPLPSGDISDLNSNHFVAAGEDFDIAVLPIRWQSGGALSGSIATQDGYCDITKVTVNFAKGEVGTLQVPLTHNLTLPTVASGGKEGSLSGTTTKGYLDDINGYYLFSDLSWNEVGQIQLQASSGDYLGIGIQPGYKAVGRFYPKYFKVSPDSTSWDYASGQDFNYMNQPFDGLDFSVEAFTATGNDIVNYRHFEPELQAKFILEEQDYLLDDSTPRLVTPIINTTSWDSRLTSSLGVFSVSAGDDCLSMDSLCWLKATTKAGYEDGPFNLFESTNEDITTVTNIVIADGGSVDPIAFRTSEDKLTVQPDLRFGRAALSSVGGVASNDGIKVPLRLEYWNGTRFVTNVNDSASDVKGSNVVASNNVIWSDVEAPGVPAEVSLSDGGMVSEGISHLIVAKQDKLERQQTQLWLELVDGNNKLPWLQYLWDSGSGVEGNPSTVVTFGIYRGNDKIIFRSESGLTGQ